jgi:integrase/recombinase XerD
MRTLATVPTHIRVLGKGRKKRATTLTGETVKVLHAWIKERQGQPDEPLFPTRMAAGSCPSLQFKRVTPHTLRHTNAMLLRAKGVDIATIALWLGHESTQTTHIYTHADPKLKEQAIARTAPLGTKPGRYRPSDALLAFLEGL